MILLMWFLIFISFASFPSQNRINTFKSAQKILWRSLYAQGGSTLYCQKDFVHRKKMNVEHIMPASWMKKVVGCRIENRKECRRVSQAFNHMEADLHNLYPALSKANAMRGSSIFVDHVAGVAPYSSQCSLVATQQFTAPPQEARGKIARALLYMAFEYDFDLDSVAEHRGFYDLMTDWHCKYPADELEKERNSKIENLQQTTNPFISGLFDFVCQK